MDFNIFKKSNKQKIVLKDSNDKYSNTLKDIILSCWKLTFLNKRITWWYYYHYFIFYIISFFLLIIPNFLLFFTLFFWLEI